MCPLDAKSDVSKMTCLKKANMHLIWCLQHPGEMILKDDFSYIYVKKQFWK